ncbi:SDR family oxidoreductase [Paracoccus laeviglucosivorans]|uniref:3-oxoacyl-[acyl-carrier protein] reductase n=1 Tax=Paracoccus laeviglucosivorans TaxID=1197861 RepID=A0A521E8Z9_9RHOB|nr:SDR family oxidoreductase [Paracoccus laeviglucosivorans]SMO80379.1 3-oxoacyl-[acyl-carrier protein] reductase [Paracoccus laeviglucosivorans]
MDLGISGKNALVFGGGGGLGGAIAQSLAAEGAQVVVADIDAEAAGRTASAITAAGGNARAVQWDIGDLSVLADRLAEIGAVDILVNNTGGPPPTPAHGQSPESWSKYFDSMVRSVIAVTDAVLPGMRERGWGRVITSTSSGVVAPIPNLGISNALRLTLVGWSKTLAREIGRDRITANIVLPGRIATGRITFLDEQKAKRENRSVAEVSAESTGSIPVGRYGEPREYGDAVAFLASARASYITGSVIRIDGGLIASI